MKTGSSQRAANGTLLAGVVFACAVSVAGRAHAPLDAPAGPADDPVIGAVLPVSGSPSSREYARLFLEGVEVAVDLARRAGVNVEFVVEDNGGTASGTVRGVAALASRGAVAVLGPLSSGNVRAAADAAPRDMAFFSPTARDLPDGHRGVYSMGSGDPATGLVLAEAVSDLGYFDAVVMHPQSPGETLEATAFADGFRARGGTVRRRVQYLPGTTTFEEPLLEAKSLAPGLLVVAAPPSDIELLGPQIAFFGLDTIGVQVAGTAGWTDAAVIDGVARRHTDGVISVSPLAPDAVDDLSPDFVAAYERRFRRSLHSIVPATGFDLFRMALAAYGAGRRTSGDLVAALERLHRFTGVTGNYSFADGRLTREYFPVRIHGGALHPVDTEFPGAARPGPDDPATLLARAG